MLIKEFKERKNTHQTHFEDLVLLGEDGLNELNDKIEKFMATISGQDVGLNTTTKIDGAPAVICWSKFEGYPDNSICLKSFVSSNKNCLSSPEDIQAKYGDRPDMAEKLMYCLQLAKCIPENEAWQGDCLYSANDLKETEISGTNYLTFHPNKIIYAFSEDNPTYETIKNSKFGICFHTIYKPSENGNKTQSFRVDAKRLSNVPDDIYVMSPALNKSNNRSDYNLDEVEKQFDALKQLEQQLLSNSDYEDLCDNSVFMGYWNTFENANLSDKRAVNIDLNSFFNELKAYIKNKQDTAYNKKLATLKTDAGKAKATDKYNADVIEVEDILNTNEKVIKLLVQTLNLAANIKMNLWSGLKKSEQGYNTFYKSKSQGYIPADMEGVAMSDADGNIVKIVDRSTFSFANRSDDIESGFDHKNEELNMGINEDKSIYFNNGPDGSEYGQAISSSSYLKDLLRDYNVSLRKRGINPHETAYEYTGEINYYGFRFTEIHENESFKRWVKSLALTEENGQEFKEVDLYKSSINGHNLTKIGITDIIKMLDNIEDNITSKGVKIILRGAGEAWPTNSTNECISEDIESAHFKIGDEVEYPMLYGGTITGKVVDISDGIITIEESWIAEDTGEVVTDDETYELTTDNNGNECFITWEYGGEKGYVYPPSTNESLTEDDNSTEGRTVVLAFGRMNPPTVGHNKLIDTMSQVALNNNAEAKLYLSHTQDAKKNPLTYDQKIEYAKKAFGDRVDVINSPAKTIIQVLQELNKNYDNLIYVGGEDRIGGAEDITATISKYNGSQEENPKAIYNFKTIKYTNAGGRNENSSDFLETVSASMVRDFVRKNDFESFKKCVPFDEATAQQLFDDLKVGLKINESFCESLNEADEEEKTFNKKLSSNVNSISAAYGLLGQELRNKLDDKAYKQFEDAVKDIETITNTLDASILGDLAKRLQESGSGLTANEFIKLFNPTKNDIVNLLKPHELKDGVNSLDTLGLEPELLDKLIAYKGGNKKSTTNIGEYEFLIALAYKDGGMGSIGQAAGDVHIGNNNIEVKKIKSPAAIGYENGEASEITKEFDNFIATKFDGDLSGRKTRPQRNIKSFNVSINKEELPNRLKAIVGESGDITYSDLFKEVFKHLITNYAKRFQYLALCYGANITMIKADESLADYLLTHCKVYFADYIFGRVFKVSK